MQAGAVAFSTVPCQRDFGSPIRQDAFIVQSQKMLRTGDAEQNERSRILALVCKAPVTIALSMFVNVDVELAYFSRNFDLEHYMLA